MLLILFISFVYSRLFIISFFNLLYDVEEILLYSFLELFPDKYEPIKTFISYSLFKNFCSS